MAVIEILVTATAGAALFLVLPKNGAAYQPEYEILVKAGIYEVRRYASFRYVEDDSMEEARAAFARLKATCVTEGIAPGVPLLCTEGRHARLPALPAEEKTSATLGDTGPFVVVVARVNGNGSTPQQTNDSALRTLARAVGYEPDPNEPPLTARYDTSPFTPERWRRTEGWIVLRPLHASPGEAEADDVASS